MSDTFFRREIHEGTEVFVGNDAARGPWDPASCHAGPPTALLARACERAVAAAGIEQDDAGQDGTVPMLARLTVDLARPIPIDGFTIAATIDRAGRSTAVTSAVLSDLDGRERVRAFGLHLRPSEDHPYPSPSLPTPDLSESVPGGFPVQRTGHGLPTFSVGAEVRYPPGQDDHPGPTTLWMRTIPVLPDDEPSGFQRICGLADSGNAIGRNAEPHDVAFVNPDLSITLHREPEGEWFGSDVISHWQPNGVGMADALLFDHRGPIGRAVQTILLRKQG